MADALQPTPAQSEDLRIEALVLALMDEDQPQISDEQAKRVLARVDVRDPLRPWRPKQ